MNRSLFVLLAGVAFGGVSNRASAQLAPQVAPQVAPNAPATAKSPTANAPAQSPKSAHYVKLKNVSASMMAFLLDPKHHPQPMRSVQGNPLITNAAVGPGLPVGVDKIIIEPQNEILIVGTEAGTNEIAKTIAFLDQQQRSVEIEVKWVEIQPRDTRSLGLENPGGAGAFGDTPAPEPFLSVPTGNFAAALSALVAQNRAKVLASTRATIINNQPTSLNSFSASPAAVNFKGKNQALAPLFEGTTQISLQLDASVTPTINPNDTVTVSLTTSSYLKIKTAAGTEFSSAQPQNKLQSILSVRNGDTIALGGLSSRSTSAGTSAKTSSNLMVFVTARIVRRADEGAILPTK